MHPEAEAQDGGLPTSMLRRVVSNNKDVMDILFEAAPREDKQASSSGRPAEQPVSPVPRTGLLRHCSNMERSSLRQDGLVFSKRGDDFS